MARYDREFLVPYLEGICALYYAKDKLYTEKEQVEREIYCLKKGTSVSIPETPEKEKGGILEKIAFAYAFFNYFLSIGLLTYVDVYAIGAPIVFFLLGCLGLGGVLVCWKRRNDEYKDRIKKYQELLSEYKLILDSDEEARKQIPKLKQIKAYAVKELRKINYLIDKAYSANIIPSRYRDRYAITYLYDWFATGGSDDMDMALNTYVLEEIKERLDVLIDYMRESILNQQIIISNQRKNMEDQRRFEMQMKSKLECLQLTEDERLRYDRMIESNTAVTAYFAAASYLK